MKRLKWQAATDAAQAVQAVTAMNNILKNKKVYLGLSGGVDSSAAACILKEQGADVTAFTLKLWRENKYGEITEIKRAKETADALGIPHVVFDLSDEFYKYVIEYFGREYKNGRTPNPCVMCNKHIKFGKVFELIGEDAFVATGHYSGVVFENGVYKIKKSKDSKKDQTYMHYNLTQDKLKRIIFPLSSKTKEEAREIVKAYGLSCCNDKESQDICFIKRSGYKEFLKNELGIVSKEGDFINEQGEPIGRHKGICEYTVGQRKKLGVAFGKPVFVTAINPKNNTVTLGEGGSEFVTSIEVKDFNFIYEDLKEPKKYDVKVRYSQNTVPALVTLQNDTLLVEFDFPVRAAAPGQSAVFYEGDYLAGGGVIKGE